MASTSSNICQNEQICRVNLLKQFKQLLNSVYTIIGNSQRCLILPTKLNNHKTIIDFSRFKWRLNKTYLIPSHAEVKKSLRTDSNKRRIWCNRMKDRRSAFEFLVSNICCRSVCLLRNKKKSIYWNPHSEHDRPTVRVQLKKCK